MSKSRLLSLTAVLVANLIYGINFSVAKIPMEGFIKPFGFVLLRSVAAVIFFWSFSFFNKELRNKNLKNKDYLKLVACAFLGASGNQLLFFKGIELTSPIAASIIMTLTPVLVFIFSLFIFKEQITKKRWLGVIIAFLGAITLVTLSEEEKSASNPILGNILVFLNSCLYGLYLVIAKPLLEKYHPIVFLKWLFLFGFFFNLPFGLNEVLQTEWQTITKEIILALAFVLIFTSCLTYLFNLYGLKNLRPSSVGVFIYLQPVFATAFALFAGFDQLDVTKLIAATLIFGGVYLVIQRKTSNSKK